MRLSKPVTPRPYSSLLRWKKLLNQRKKRPNSRSITRITASLGASCGRSRMAASAGDRVSELMAEITVEIAIVAANCL